MAKKTSSPKRTHVVKRDSGWAVKKEGAQRATKVYKTKEQAVKGAEKNRKSGSDVVIHKEDGSIQQWKKSKK
ncbi:MAG: DUF2188 domain-containing protein [Chitinophagales bacterium]|nr:DUF2188 domain-containing protein [Chitinophagales bacterium]